VKKPAWPSRIDRAKQFWSDQLKRALKAGSNCREFNSAARRNETGAAGVFKLLACRKRRPPSTGENQHRKRPADNASGQRLFHPVFASISKESAMPNHIYQKLEITGSSSTGIQEAIENAIAKAAETHQGLRWFEVTETRGHIENGKVAHWQVTVKIGFALTA